MKKAFLISEPPVEIPGNVKGKKSGTIFTGRVLVTGEGRVLETDVWDKGILKLRHFTGQNNYWNYNATLGTWDGCTLRWAADNVDLEVGEYREAVEEFAEVETWRAYARGAVYNREDRIKWDKEDLARKRKFKRINEEQKDMCPNLPKDFMRFAKKCAEGEKEGASFGIQLYQEANNKMIVERQFRVEKDGGLTITEEARGYNYAAGAMWEKWVYGVYRSEYGSSQDFWDKKNGTAVHVNLQRKFYLYTKNLDDIFEEAEFIKKLTKLAAKAEWSQVMGRIRNSEALKHIYNAGLTRMVTEIVEDKGQRDARISPKPTKLSDYLQITPQQLAYLKEANGGWKSLAFLQVDDERKLRTKELIKLEKVVTSYSFNAWKQIFGRGLNLNHVMTLLADKKGRIRTDAVLKYGDYLDMAEERGSDIHDEIIYRNKRWTEFHDRYVEEINERIRRQAEAEKEAKADNFKGIRKDYGRNCELFAWENKEFCIEVPKSSKDIIREGQKQHHCVGASDRYMAKMATRKTFILFLRKTEDRKKPFYTIEADLNHIIQAYGAYDRKPEWETVKPVLDKWMAQVRKNARKQEKKGAA